MENGYHMFLYKNKIVVTGGSGRFGFELKKLRINIKYAFQIDAN